MKIKVCGLRDPGNIEQVVKLRPNYIGFIFYDKSPRFVNEIPVELLKAIPTTVAKTAVFVNETAENIETLIAKYNFDAIQLHGNESPAFCALFKGRVKVIKAFGLSTDFDFTELYPYVDHVDLFLFDTKTSSHGGSGETFDWTILDKYDLDKPFFLSGGLSLDNLDEVKNITHPQFYGVDLNSRFEIEPGLKNINKLETAFNLLKQDDTNEIRS
ncbi:phosphoribosylanthranilate isomerase [Mucilaginibacter sp.]